MKVITLYQPWATLVAIGAKKIETRSWGTNYRGLLAIHAGTNKRFASMKSKDYLCGDEPFRRVLTDEAKRCDGLFIMPFGEVVAICELEDCFKITGHREFNPSEQERAFGDYTLGRYAWKLKDIKRLQKSIPMKGKRGLWEWKG